MVHSSAAPKTPQTTSLHVGGHEISRSQNGTLEVEYALFDPAEIELQALEPGSVWEVGYRTTVAKAKERLESYGITPDLAATCAEITRAKLAHAYAKNDSVRLIVNLLGPLELFESRTFNADGKYEGTFMDLAAMGADLEVSHASELLQALHLTCVLQEAQDDELVVLSTTEYTRERRPGERTHRRVALDDAGNLPSALSVLGSRERSRATTEESGSRLDLMQLLKERLTSTTRTGTRARLEQALRNLQRSEPPERGPLAQPELWAIEQRLGAGETSGLAELIDGIEVAKGRTPATAYLRAHLALVGKTEDPRAIAERVSALALSMTSFNELELLAAQAWFAAGEARRALPYARDLLADSHAREDIRAQAQVLADTIAATSPSLRPTSASRPSVPPAPMPEPARPSQRPPPSSQGRPIEPSPIVPIGVPSAPPPSERAPSAAPTGASAKPPPAGASAKPPPARVSQSPPSDQMPAAPPVEIEIGSTTAVLSAAPHASAPSARPMPSARPQTEARAQADSAPRVQARASVPAQADPAYMRGASRPPYNSDAPMVAAPRAQALPAMAPREAELAEHLSLPPGLHGQVAQLDVIPRTMIEARVQFTLLSRELGRDYRVKHNVELRTDLTGIERMQRFLRETFPHNAIRSAEEAHEVRRHGAFLSEILARMLGGEWVDIGPTELGYWAMRVPPQTRVWPFGRVIRFIAMGHKERDLVSYYLELQARSMGLK